MLAEGLAEGIENAVSAVPSSFAGTALNDKTWEGNPLLNFAERTYEGVKGAVQIGAVMHGARGAYGAASSHIRLSTPEGRLITSSTGHTSSMAQNPNATHQDFLNSPEAHHAKAEIEKRGLTGEQRKIAKAGEPEASKAEPAAGAEVTPKPEPKPEGAAHPEVKPEADGTRRGRRASERCRAGRERRSAERASGHGRRSRDAGFARRTAKIADRPRQRRVTTLEGNWVLVIPDPRGPGHGVRVGGPPAPPPPMCCCMPTPSRPCGATRDCSANCGNSRTGST